MKKIYDVIIKVIKDKKILFLLALGAAGILLLFFSGTKSSSNDTVKDDCFALKSRIETELEKKTEKLLSTVAGVGKVKVIITLDSLETYEYAKNREERGDGEKDEFVVVKQSGDERGLSEKVVMPGVRGVAVSCSGGGSAAVKKEVSGLVCAALGIAANKVYVSRMAE